MNVAVLSQRQVRGLATILPSSTVGALPCNARVCLRLINTYENMFVSLAAMPPSSTKIFDLFFGRVHETHFHALPSLIASKTPLCIDIGANIGQSVVSLKTLFPNAAIHSFEPVPTTYRKLAHAVRIARGVTLHNVALGAVCGEVGLRVPYCEDVPFDQFSSVEVLDPTELAAAFQYYGYDWVRAEKIRFVEQIATVEPLDAFDFAPDFIKIDAEGAELDVLRGGSGMIERNLPVLLVEVHGREQEISQYLKILKYQSFAFVDGRLDPKGLDYHSMFTSIQTPTRLTKAGWRRTRRTWLRQSLLDWI